MPAAILWIGVAFVGWAVMIVMIERAVAPALARQCGGDAWRGLACALVRVYARVVHNVRFDGAEDLRAALVPGPLIVVANHTAGIDPLLIQSGCRFYIRWMMADDMMVASMGELWRWAEVIPVTRDGGDRRSLRESLAQLRGGRVVGVFPEGGITRPRGRIGPFMPGLGLLAAKSGAPLLLAFVSGTPEAPTAFASLGRPSRSSIRFRLIPPYPPSTSGVEIVTDVRRQLAEMGGWSLVDEIRTGSVDQQ